MRAGDIDAVVAACRAGAALAVPRAPQDLFNEILAQHMAAEFGADERCALMRVEQAGAAGLAAARRGALIAAEGHFQRAMTHLDAPRMSERAHRLADSMLCAQRAYFAFRRGEVAAAEALLARAADHDLWLERACGLRILQAHRIQLLHNRMRIAVRGGHAMAALSLGCALLSHLEDGDLAIPAPLIAALHHQIALEQVAALHGMTTRDDLCRLPACGNTQVGRWLAFQMSDGDRLRAAIPLLQSGPVPSMPLWRAVADEVSVLFDLMAAS